LARICGEKGHGLATVPGLKPPDQGFFSVRAFTTYLVIDGDGAIQERIVGMNPRQTIVSRLKDRLSAMSELNDDKKR